MADDDDGPAVGMKGGKDGDKGGFPEGIETCGGFVEDKDSGIHGKDAGNCRKTLLAAGKGERGSVIQPAVKAESAQSAESSFPCLFLAHIQRAVHDVFKDGAGKELALGELHDHAGSGGNGDAA